MNKENSEFIEHILQAISDILEFVDDMDFEEFVNDKRTRSAVVCQFEIIGEASKNISEKFKKEHDDIPWKKMSGMRDKLIHAYFGIDLDEVWRTVQKDIPELKNKLEKCKSIKK